MTAASWLRGLFGVLQPEDCDVARARRAGIRAEMDRHPAEAGEGTGRRDRERRLHKRNYWRATWQDRESGE